MTRPIHVDLPHSLGQEEARRRIANGIGGLSSFIPGGADVRSSWAGNHLDLHVSAMAQTVQAGIDVEERVVRVEVVLPPALSFFGRAVEAALRRGGAQLLEDKSKP